MIILALKAKFPGRLASVWRMGKQLAQALRRAVTGDRYRPEKHFMRGPGPKTLDRRLVDSERASSSS